MYSRIEVNPEVCHGKPVIRGTRIMVRNILGALAGGDSIEDILRNYPELNHEDIEAALRYAIELIDDTRFMKADNFLNRYTSIPVLLDILLKERLVLLDPSTWEDKNDSYYLLRYQNKKCLKTLLAICFTSSRETSHHWKVYANSISGVCIEIDRAELIKIVEQHKDFKYRDVEYPPIKTLTNKKPNVEDMPFIKRYPFKDEKEFRIIYESADAKHSTYELKINLAIIKKITFSPIIPLPIFETIKELIEKNIDCKGIVLNRSSLLENEQWKKIADEA